MKQTILVTGGTGYIGSWVVKGLLEHGHHVRLTVRNIANKGKYSFLEDLAAKNKGSLELWEADLLKEGSFDKAADGCDSIAHIASPFKLEVNDAQKELVDPALNGTRNVLEAANKSSTVKKVVLTSSVAAIYGDNIDMKDQGLTVFTEAQFNTTASLSHQPYSFSKIEAEKKAWEIAKQQKNWELIVMNPSFVMGPSLSATSASESLKFMTDMLTGKFKMGAAELYMGYVDVRDVAQAHIIALENEAEGRFILSERVTTMLSLADIIREHYGSKYPLPSFNTPKFLVSLIGVFFGLSRKFVQKNVGIPIKFDSTKSKKELGLEYTPLEETIKDMVDHWEASRNDSKNKR